MIRNMNRLKKWIKASRPHTMGLSFAVIFAGSGLVGWPALHLSVLSLALLAAGGFQLLSNFANDYGDFHKGTDSHREETYRALSGANFTVKQIKTAIVLLAIVSLLATVFLVVSSPVSVAGKWLMFALGIASIIAAMAYTLGKRPYGYYALGDIMVFIFFGMVGVVGSYYLQGGNPANPGVWLIAVTFGALSTTVLNINNIRDNDSDKRNGKITVANVLGKNAIVYQRCLFITALLGLISYSLFINVLGWLPTVVTGLLIYYIQRLLGQASKHADFNHCLATTVKTTLLIGLLVCLAGLLHNYSS
ncbi:MAG: 1,4-dihydroxy-2-naphthoate octaprenyltransferase [Gammaproteobacteria bacterium]|nr:MAG: 1,4-dihydroxy-2-naphthoate octaprenyltransferase [Gammaproteobacteria bacterium]